MKTKILLAALAGALVMPVPLVSQADVMGGTDFTIYGRVIAGLDRQHSDVPGQNATWDIGATGRDGSGQQQSRLGFKADRDLGGMTVGFKMEQGINSGGNAGLNTRHRYVYMSGDFGTITIGNQGNPYLMGANWAQEWYLGGNTLRTFRDEGVGYAWSNGTFNLNVLLTGNNGNAAAKNTPHNADEVQAARAALADATTAAARVTAERDLLAALNNDPFAYRVADETIDRTIIGASYDFGVVKVGFGYDKDNTERGYDWTAFGVSGSVDRFGYYVGYQSKDDAEEGSNLDQAGWGTFVSYDISDADRVYLEYETLKNDYGAKTDTSYTVFGYSHNFGASTRFIGEYRITDRPGSVDPSRLALTVMVSF